MWGLRVADKTKQEADQGKEVAQTAFDFGAPAIPPETAPERAASAPAVDQASEGLTRLATGSADVLMRARAEGLVTPLDRQFAERLATLYGDEREGVRWALALACHQEASGHVCADLRRLASDGILSEVAGEQRQVSPLLTHDRLEDWLSELESCALVETPGAAGEPRPLILDDRGRLYLRRAYQDQAALAERLLARGGAASFEMDERLAEETIARLAPIAEGAGDAGDEVAREALRVGLRRGLSVVTGGPGTGKTTMVARLIALLVEMAMGKGDRAPRVKLLAPTGKAAAAMANAFARGRDVLDVSQEVRDALPRSAETIHRALHGQTRLDAFGRPRAVTIDADVVVIDEASMVDLELMSRLMAACEGVPRVVLLGDPDQLASVDSGAVLGEICRGGETPAATGLGVSLIRLTRSHRFSESGGIGRLAAAIRAGNADEALALLEDPDVEGVERVDVGAPEEVVARLIAESHDMHTAIATESEMNAKLDQMSRYRVLCAHRRGPLGVENLGARLDQAASGLRETTPQAGWWSGRMLLVTRNAPDQDLWNGDVGLIEETNDGLRALFPDGAGGVRALSAGRLPNHESAIAMSVHKSQGSEFDAVDLVLGDRPSPIMTRELFYTGVTRARKTLRVHASAASIRAMIERRIERDSGLSELLWPDLPSE